MIELLAAKLAGALRAFTCAWFFWVPVVGGVVVGMGYTVLDKETCVHI